MRYRRFIRVIRHSRKKPRLPRKTKKAARKIRLIGPDETPKVSTGKECVTFTQDIFFEIIGGQRRTRRMNRIIAKIENIARDSLKRIIENQIKAREKYAFYGILVLDPRKIYVMNVDL